MGTPPSTGPFSVPDVPPPSYEEGNYLYFLNLEHKQEFLSELCRALSDYVV